MNTRIRPRTGLPILAVSALAIGLGLAGCTAAAPAKTEADTAPAPSAAPTGCEEAAALDGVVMAQLGGEPTDEALLAVAEAYQAAGDAMHDGPAEAHDAAHTAAETITRAVDDGAGPAALEDPAYLDATVALGEFLFEECGYESLAVTAKDFAFEGLPDEVPAGIAVVQLTNTGENPHVVEVSRIPDDATTADEIVADPEAAMGSGLIEMIAGGAFAEPGMTGYLTVDLEPGRYLITCMIPDSDNVTHAAHGMFHELTVQ